MVSDKSQTPGTSARGEPLRQRVIDAAERLLRDGKADFAMRDLAAEAGVSFATPFNQFGSKAAIMHALSARRIDMMMQRFTEVPSLSATADRVMLAVDIAAGVMLEEPEVNRAVMGWLGTAGPAPGQVLTHSIALWTLALEGGERIVALGQRERILRLATQLAFAFRGVLSFWTAGELPDDRLAPDARGIASTLLLDLTGQGVSMIG